MEELQVIETTSGRQFKPWASREDVQAIKQETVQAVVQAVQDPASVTAVTSEIASGKAAIASAINAKGGEASATESFSELADDITYTISGEDFLTKWFKGAYPYDGGVFNSDIDYLAPYKMYGVPFTEINLQGLTDFDAENFKYCNNLRVIRLASYAPTSIRSGSNFFRYNPNLEEIYLNAFNYNVDSFMRYNSAPIKKIYAPNWDVDFSTLGTYSYFGSYGLSPRQITNLTFHSISRAGDIGNVNIGNNVRSVMLTQPPSNDLYLGLVWACSNVIAEGQSGIDELNTNVQALAATFLDYTGMTGHIITFNADLYNVLTEVTKQMFTNKNWAVAYS